MKEETTENGSPNQEAKVIRLNNQAIEVWVNQNSARFTVNDLVAKVRWRMDPYLSESGRLVFSDSENAGIDNTYFLGKKGDKGVRFKHKYSYVRSDVEDDYSSLTLEGPLGDDKETLVEIEFLLSEAFPTLDICLRIHGDIRDTLSQIAFPIGMAITTEESGDLIVPKSRETFIQDPVKAADQFKNMHPTQGHVTHGQSMFAMTKQSESGRDAGCLGFLDHQYAELDVRSDETLSVATPGIRNAMAALDGWNSDYRFRYCFVPDATPEALAWLCREHILKGMALES